MIIAMPISWMLLQ